MTSASQPPRVRNVSPSSRFFFPCKNCRSGEVYLQSPSGEELWLPPTAKSNEARMIFLMTMTMSRAEKKLWALPVA